MSFRLQVKIGRLAYRKRARAEWPRQKDNILLQRGLLLESSFDTSRHGGKTTALSKGSLPRYCRLRAPSAPNEVATSAPVTQITAPIGNYLKNAWPRCRPINHSFTPAWKCWDQKRKREAYQCLPP